MKQLNIFDLNDLYVKIVANDDIMHHYLAKNPIVWFTDLGFWDNSNVKFALN